MPIQHTFKIVDSVRKKKKQPIINKRTMGLALSWKEQTGEETWVWNAFTCTKYPVHGYAWLYIAIVAFSIKHYWRGTKASSTDIWWYHPTRLSIEALNMLNGWWWYLTENFSLRIAVILEGFHLKIFEKLN
jgi:hypothetical protein